MAVSKDDLGIEDSLGLTDADCSEIHRLSQVYRTGGERALMKAMKRLARDPVQAVKVYGALFPAVVREVLKDQVAERGITEKDLQKLRRERGRQTRAR
jgi:hypothetical protein